jgi:hypothetical protein
MQRVLPAHSSHLLQTFDIYVASPLKTAFKQELEKSIVLLTPIQNTERKQIIRRVVVESFINALRREATPGNIESGFRWMGFIPFNPEVPLVSAYAVDPVDPGLFRPTPTGTEVNEMILTSPEGLEFLYRQDNKKEVMEDNHQIEWRQFWETLESPPVVLGKQFSEPPPLSVRGDRNVTVQIHIPKIPL